MAETLPGMEIEPPPPAGRFGVDLTAEQEQAVARRSESLIVSAAAGSGKTSVLVERFVRAVRDDHLAPGKILAITFTERAAGELRSRVRGRLLELGDREAARDTEAAFVGTFHGFCARLLRSHPLAAGLDPAFEVIDEGLAGRLRELAFKAALREFLVGERSEAIDLLAAYRVDRVRTMIEQIYAELRSRGQRRPRLPAGAPKHPVEELGAHAVSACELLDELLDRFGASYEARKAARAAVDFDDLELRASELLDSREDVRSAWSQRFELLMVDEFQDTNPRQLGILGALDRDNLFTVGDEFQSIYGFRHADVSLFRERRAELERHGASVALTQNFRSRESLLDVVNALFADRFSGFAPLVPGREAAEPAPEPVVELLLSDTEGWEEREQLAERVADGLPHAQPWRQAEARLLAQRVAELVDSGEARAGDVVVLLRASGDLEVFERALQLRGLRTLAAVGAFWGHQQIGDLIAYLRALANPLDEEALYGVLASPLVGVSRDALALIADAARAARRGAWATILDAVIEHRGLLARLQAHDREALAGFCERLQRERDTASRHTISELIERAIAAAGYREHVLALDWGERRLANVQKLLRLARRFEAGEGRDLRAFLDHVEHLRETARVEPDAPVDGVEPDAVRLMTVHAAKGLEFPVVCLADLGRQPNIQTPDLLVDGERIGLRVMRLDGGKSTPALDYGDLCEERRRREAEEEDRILYVAMTRARDRLLLSGSIAFDRWPKSSQAPTPISWLGPALDEQLPTIVASREATVHELRIGSSGAVNLRCRLSSAASLGTVGLMSESPARAELSETFEGSASASRAERRARAPAAAGAPGARRPPVEGRDQQQLSALSYTSLTELERCGYRYYLERVLRLSEDRAAARVESPAGGLEARSRGTLVHALMESFDFANPRPVSERDVAVAAGGLGLRPSAQERAEVAALIDRAARAQPAARVAAAGAVRREQPFAFSLGEGEPLITGFIDLLASERDGSQLVLDYKSDRVGPAVDLEELVEQEYGIQRLLYALAVLRDGALGLEIVHWFLERPEEWVTASYTAADRTPLEAQLAARIARARERGFAVSPNPHRGLCLTCPGRAGLCSWGEAETLREDLTETPSPTPEPG